MAKNRTNEYKERLANVTTNDEVRGLIIQAAQEKGGVGKTLDAIFREAYGKTHGKFIDSKGKQYKAKNAMNYDQFVELVGNVLALQSKGVKLNVGMRYHYLFVTGDTREVKSYLRGIGFYWDHVNVGWGFKFQKAPDYSCLKAV